jgi:ABC-type sugar transport system ATPase subunit
MNLYRGQIVHEKGKNRFEGPGFAVDIGRTQIPAGEAELGIRPEDIRMGGPEFSLTARVQLVSHLGAEKIVNSQIGNAPITFCVSKESRLQADDRVYLVMPPEGLHFFRNGLRVD